MTPEREAFEAAYSKSLKIMGRYKEHCVSSMASRTSAAAAQGEPVHAFYKDAEAEPPYAQFARGVKEGFELGRRNATQDAANVAPAQPPREPLSDERIDAIPFMFNLTFGEADGHDEEEMAVALRKFARAVLAAAQEKT